MSDIIENLPNIYAQDNEFNLSKKGRLYSSCSNIDFNKVRSSFGIALHMHQPTIPAGGGDLAMRHLISNLQHMFENQAIGDNHNAGVFFWCYHRLAQIIPDLVKREKAPG